MITKQEIEKAGYRVLPDGGWFRIDRAIMNVDWYKLCDNFDIDPECEEIILCVCGVKEIHEGDEK